MVNEKLRFTCPSCSAKLAAVESMNHATQVVKRTCKGCRETWQLVVATVLQRDDVRLDKAEFTFLGRRKTSVK